MQRKIRLMQITHDLAIGGLQQVVVNLCRTIDRETFDVSVLCLRKLGSLVPEVERLGIKVNMIPQKRNTDYIAFMKVARMLRQERIQVIHTHNTQPFVDGTLAAMLSGVRTIVHTDHARDFPDKRRYMLAERLMSHFAYKVVGVSDHTSKNLIQYLKIPARKIITIPNGIDGSRFADEIDKPAKRQELGIPGDGPIIGVGVRLDQQKGLTYLLQAMPMIVRQVPGTTLVIAGEGPIEYELKCQAAEMGLTGSVKWIGPRLDIPDLLKLFDLYVLPSNWEGLPVCLIEAMAAGCPIVTTDVGGVRTAIQSGYNGILLAPKDPQGLAKETVRLLLDSRTRQIYAANGRRLFEQRFTAEKMTRAYERLYLRQT